MKIVKSDETGDTTFQMVYNDHVKLCKDKQVGEALDQIDLSYRHIFPIVVVLIICCFLTALCIVKAMDALCSIPQSHSKCAFPVIVIFVIVLYFDVRDERYKSYEKALRERIILDRIEKQWMEEALDEFVKLNEEWKVFFICNDEWLFEDW